MDPNAGDVLPANLVGADKGDAWTGFEWVKPARYEELRATTMPHLPPLQPVPGQALNAMGGSTGPAPWQHPRHGEPGPLEAAEYERQEREREEGVVFDLLKEVIGEDPRRGGLLETPARVRKAWKHWTSGYHKNPADILKVFEDGAEKCDEMVVVRGIPIYSHCEHHLAPIIGTCTIGYLPNGRIVGLSKLNRLADMFARRLQVQERMTNQIADALMEYLAPAGCGVVVTARHMCMESRGVMQRSATSTSALRGNFKEDPTVRNEFLSLARTKR